MFINICLYMYAYELIRVNKRTCKFGIHVCNNCIHKGVCQHTSVHMNQYTHAHTCVYVYQYTHVPICINTYTHAYMYQ